SAFRGDDRGNGCTEHLTKRCALLQIRIGRCRLAGVHRPSGQRAAVGAYILVWDAPRAWKAIQALAAQAAVAQSRRSLLYATVPPRANARRTEPPPREAVCGNYRSKAIQ